MGLKTDVVSVFVSFSLKLLKLQERVLHDVVIYLLGDEDPRVRHVAAAALIRYLPPIFSLWSLPWWKCEVVGGGELGHLRVGQHFWILDAHFELL